MTTEQIEYVLQVLDLNNPLTRVDQNSPKYESLQTMHVCPNTILPVGRPTNHNSPDIILKADDISRKQGLVYVLGETDVDGKPIMVYQDTGRNKPVATFTGHNADLRRTRLQEGKKVRIHLEEELTFGQREDYSLKFTVEHADSRNAPFSD